MAQLNFSIHNVVLATIASIYYYYLLGDLVAVYIFSPIVEFCSLHCRVSNSKEKCPSNTLSNISFILFKWATEQPSECYVSKDFWRSMFPELFYSDGIMYFGTT